MVGLGILPRPWRPQAQTYTVPLKVLLLTKIPTSPSITLGVASSSGISFRNMVATDSRASAGHSLNQSIVQQLTREGNCLR